ncbi:cupin domain-containing protein [Paenibacillus sp. CF384]|uniref:cupin domain-containing protein n=1 Tax=Paenibacillus sp. CF384 TaxID=1884382 RepID=UPI000896A381|nr:cupin domain-containing protein [Paenibacillus sp. CF384]SDY00458.1 Cupin domain-containing protein [Paenibacillus sp. CF384]
MSNSMNAPITALPLLGQTLSIFSADLVMAEWTADGCLPGSEPMRIAPLHIHHEDDEAWYVLEGKLAIQIGDSVVEASGGSAVIAPRGVKHTFWNPAPEPARYLLIMNKRIQSLIDAIHAMEQRDPEAMKALFAQYQAELLE